MINKKFHILVWLFLLFTSCARVSSSYSPELNVSSRRGGSAVTYFTRPPSRIALRIGTISVKGNGYAKFDDLLAEAKQLAAQYHGDFILPENSGISTSTAMVPGHSSYQSNFNANYNAYQGYASGYASGYSVGPSVYTIHRPWSIFSVWVYTPSQLGISVEKNNRISGFHLNSDAQAVDVKIGDVLIGIDGVDVNDNRILNHIMTIYPGNKIKITIIRGQERLERQITAVSN